MPKTKSDSRLLMERIIKTVTKSDWSPIEWDSAVRQIAVGSTEPEDAKELSHSLLDWYCPIRELDLSEEDQAILDQDADDPKLDKTERKQLLRKQRKAAKRARAKGGKFTSKVDGEFINLVGSILGSCSPAQAADKLAFVSVLSEQLNINEMKDLLNRIRRHKAAFKPPRTPISFRDLLAVDEDLPVSDRVGVYEYIYVAAHYPLVSLAKGLNERERFAAADEDWKFYLDNPVDAGEFYFFEGQQVPMEELLEVDSLRFPNKKRSNFLMMGALDVPVMFKPEADYSLAVEYLNTLNEVIKRKQVPTKWEKMDDFLKDAKELNLEFDIPITLSLENQVIGGCKVTTITSSSQLNANRNYMGNCTGGLKNRLENGNSVLFIVEDSDGMRHNVHYNKEGRVLESKARHNAQSTKQVKDMHGELGQLVKRAFEN